MRVQTLEGAFAEPPELQDEPTMNLSVVRAPGSTSNYYSCRSACTCGIAVVSRVTKKFCHLMPRSSQPLQEN